MLSMGLGLRVSQVTEPLLNQRLVAVALFANFVVVPAAAVLLAEALSLGEDIRIALILISVAAGAPLVPKLVQIAGGNVATAVGLVALMVVVTIGYMPIVLPLLLPDVDVDVVGIAVTLSLQLLLPLIVGLAVKDLFDSLATGIQPKVALAGNGLLVALLVLTFGLNLGDVLDLFGSGGIISILLLIAIAAAAGYALGGERAQGRRGLALSTAQRNIAAAFVVGLGNFSDRHEVLAMLASAGLLGMLTVIPLAFVFGKVSQRNKRPAEAPPLGPFDADALSLEDMLSEAEPGSGDDQGGDSPRRLAS
jgi:BASS family bile acid:Na+ symporter